MSTLLRLFLYISLIVIAYLMITRPRAIRQIGARARLVGYAWVAAVIIGAIMQLAGWRT